MLFISINLLQLALCFVNRRRSAKPAIQSLAMEGFWL